LYEHFGIKNLVRPGVKETKRIHKHFDQTCDYVCKVILIHSTIDSEGYLLLLLTSTRILAPLGKEQVINLLVNAGHLYPAIADNIINAARKDPAHRKLFVHGLTWEIAS
jgi:hypothetical protein